MTHRYTHLMPRKRDWPIAKLSEARSAFVDEIVADMEELYSEQHSADMMDDLAQVVRSEFGRIRHQPWNVDPPNESNFWKKIDASLNEARTMQGDAQAKAVGVIFRRIVRVYSEEIAGRFKPRVFQFARYFSNVFFSILFNRFIGRMLPFWGGTLALDQRIKLVGYIEEVRQLFDEGVVVMVPTHSSNLDSLFLGYAMDRYAGLPSPHYGAGLNLYNNELAGYFMNRLGAYRVDRRKKNKVYLDTLKSASRMSLARGVNSLFFPGGTRSRSGELEQQLKTGLLGSTVEAQREFIDGDAYKRVCIVPVVLSYSKVLEDVELMQDYIKKSGMSRDWNTVIKKRSTVGRWWSILVGVFTGRMMAYVSFGKPLDVFGNELDDTGRSMDEGGQHIIKRDYFSTGGVVSKDPQRERQYTRYLAKSIAESYRKNNVVLVSHVVCQVWLEILLQRERITDWKDALRLPKSSWHVSWTAFDSALQEAKGRYEVMAEAGECRIAEEWPSHGSKAWVDLASSYLGTYSGSSVVWRSGDELRTDHLGILLFYAQRLAHESST